MNDAEYNRGVALRARQLLEKTSDAESREMLKAVIRIFGDPRSADDRRPIIAIDKQRAHAAA